jgi:hypothetical protein
LDGDQPCRKAATDRTTQTQKKRGLTSMRRVGFEPAISVFDRAKAFYALDRAATVTGCAKPVVVPSRQYLYSYTMSCMKYCMVYGITLGALWLCNGKGLFQIQHIKKVR